MNQISFLQQFLIEHVEREFGLRALEEEQMNRALLESRELFDETDTTHKNDNAELIHESQKYSTLKIKNKRKEICCICMENFSCNQLVYWLDCKHIFHENCLCEWVKYKNECPTCRKTIDLK
jgi:hypothetical protein